MSANESSSRARLRRFLIFNSAFGPREGEEHLKTVFYHPTEDDRDKRAQNVGFAEASFNFAQAFSHPDKDDDKGQCKVVSTKKTKTAFLKVAGDFVFALTVSVPFCTKRKSSRTESDSPSHAVPVYCPEDVHDQMLLECLLHSYEAFCWFTPASSMDAALSELCNDDKDAFRDLLDSFFTCFLPTIKHRVERTMPCPEDLYRPLQFLSLEAGDFMRCRCFCNQITDEFGQVAKVVLLQEGNLVWSDLQQEDVRLLYQYVAHTLLPSALPTANVMTKRSPFIGHQGKFLAGGPSNLSPTANISEQEWKTPTVRLNNEDSRDYQLLVYHAVAATVCLFVPTVHHDLPDEFFRHFDASVGPRLADLSTDLIQATGEQQSSQPTMRNSASSTSLLCSPVGDKAAWQDLSLLSPPPPSVDYFYFNRSNLAMRSTLDAPSGDNDVPLCTSAMRHLLLDAAELFEERRRCTCVPCPPLECYSKTHGDRWAVSKCSGGDRVLLAEVQAKERAGGSARCNTLMDASDQVDRLVERDLKNILMLPN